MSIFQLATVLIYVTSVLTSPVNQALNNDQNSPNPALKRLFSSSQNSTENSTLSTDTRVEYKNDSNTSPKTGTTASIMTEGGPLGPPSITTETKSSVILADSQNMYESSPGLMPSEKKIAYEQPKIHPRKEAIQEETRKVVGRKGVDSQEDLLTKSPTDAQMLNPTKASTELPVEAKPSSPVIKDAEDKSSAKDINLDKNLEANTTKHVANVIYVDQHNMTAHKHKPTSTTGEGDDDGKGMPSSPTQKEIGMPRKVDYIVPLVITIMATPVLGIAAYILYTRGRDCWDKRHYRRMDFLVDGMYND